MIKSCAFKDLKIGDLGAARGINKVNYQGEETRAASNVERVWRM